MKNYDPNREYKCNRDGTLSDPDDLRDALDRLGMIGLQIAVNPLIKFLWGEDFAEDLARTFLGAHCCGCTGCDVCEPYRKRPVELGENTEVEKGVGGLGRLLFDGRIDEWPNKQEE